MSQAQKPKSLSPRHYRVVFLHHQGLNRQQIADATGYKITRISQIINSDAGVEYLEQLRAEERAVAVAEGAEGLRAAIEAEALPSIRKLARLRESATSERTQAYSAANLLDRSVPRKIVQAPASPQIFISDRLMDKLIKALEEGKRVDAAIAAEEAELVDPKDPDPSE